MVLHEREPMGIQAALDVVEGQIRPLVNVPQGFGPGIAEFGRRGVMFHAHHYSICGLLV